MGDIEANRSESMDDFIHKSAIVQKEAAETVYWIEVCQRAGICDSEQFTILGHEARELLAIFTTINRHAKGR
jgi:four helix bundle protein